MYFIVAKYKSKYGLILYAAKTDNVNPDIDMNNVYLNTLYFKGREDIEVGKAYNFSTVKGENGFTYCFLV